MGKGEIAHCEQFLLFPLFSKDLYSRQVKSELIGKGLEEFAEDRLIIAQIEKKYVFYRLESNEGKGENCGYQHFFLFPHCFQKSSFPGL